MSRAKPKKRYSLSFPQTKALSLSENTFVLLRDDLNLDPRKHAARIQAFRTALVQKLERFLAWKEFQQTIPSIREQMAELAELQPKIRASFEGLLALSPLARERLIHAYADAGITDPPRIEEFRRRIDCAIGDLAVLEGALKQAQKTWRRRPIGRPPEPVHTFIRDLASLFSAHDAGDHYDETARRSARDAFIRHALEKALNIRHPKRFDTILPTK